MGNIIECTKEQPWDRAADGRVRHHDAHEVPDSQRNGWPSGDTVKMHCKNCGHTWTIELPQ